MAIIISKYGRDAKKIDAMNIEKESYLQAYIHNNPEAIPVYDIHEDKKLLVVAREFPTESGPIDALAIDKDGDIYIVETKLYKNPDKRLVVAQALDYGASLWKHAINADEFINAIDQKIQKQLKVSLHDKAKDFFELDDEQVNTLLELLRQNLSDGNLKFVVLMNSLGERLKNLILYINQNSQFDIYAVELEYYKHDEYEIVIPKLFGMEVKKNLTTAANGLRRKWSKEDFLQDAAAKIADIKTLKKLTDIYGFIENTADEVDLGSGTESGSITFKIQDERSKSGLVSIFTLWTRGAIRFRFANIEKRIGKKYVSRLHEKLKAILPPGTLPDDPHKDSFRVFITDAFKDMGSLQKFKAAIVEYVNEIKKDGEGGGTPLNK